MAPNAGKCHFMCLGKDTRNETFILKDLEKNKKYLGLLYILNWLLKVTLRIHEESHTKNRCFIKTVKSSKWFSEKIIF